MKGVFADTSFFVAFLNPRDAYHNVACRFMADHAGPIVTTTWVLVELGNFLAATPGRKLFSPFIRELRADPRFVWVSAIQFVEAGLEMYADRSDKTWSMTDCISFVVMKRRDLTDSLTSDHHFEQAGFQILLVH